MEPGIYLRENGLADLCQTFKGIASDEEITGFISKVSPVYEKYTDTGVLIEDDVLITDTGNIVLSEKIPKEANDIERLMVRKKSWR